MYKIYADEKRIFLDNWNAAYGNKILHVLFLINLAEKKQRKPVMYKGSNLDSLFNFNFETIDIEELPVKKYYFIEKDSFYIQNSILKYLNFYYSIYNLNLDSVILNTYKSFLEKEYLLNNRILPNEEIKIRGLFWDYDLMPKKKIFDKYISIRPEITDYIENKYPNISDSNNVGVHFRGTDFNGFMGHLFPNGIKLDKDYYLQAIESIESKIGTNITYHLFSDSIDFLRPIFENKQVIIHNDSPIQDWVSLYSLKNVIQSNSSYCWTASLFNKEISLQPKYGLNYYLKSGSYPFGFMQNNSKVIESDLVVNQDKYYSYKFIAKRLINKVLK
ncbi:hypothetical protein OAQ99_06500 [Candidatus Kapabacteria bacterium]|nr:hypothetical protein [Candidatus Kapabacteria bacterium]